MKNKLIILCLVLCALCFCLCYACGKENNPDTITIDGEVNHREEAAIEIIGAEDLHIALTVKNYDEIGAEVYGVKDGDILEATADASAVSFGVAGSYKIVYKCQDVSVEKTVFIYGEPTISAGNGVTCKYSRVWAEYNKGVSAKDSFGNELPVFIGEDGGLFNKDGSVNTGAHTVKFYASDKAGQKVYAGKVVTVESEKDPVMAESFDFDVADESLFVALGKEDREALLGVSVNDEAIDKDKTAFTEDGIVISGRDVCVRTGAKDSVIRVFTNKGQATGVLKVKDEKPLQYSDEKIKAFSQGLKNCFDTHVLPEIIKLNEFQSVDPVYTITSPDGATETVSGEYKFKKSGEYTFSFSARSESHSYTIETFFDLGFKDGRIYGETSPFDETVKDGFTLKQLSVKEAVSGKAVAYYEQGHSVYGDIEAFRKTVLALNADMRYNLGVFARRTEDGETYSQTVNFGVVKNGCAILSADEIHLVPRNSANTSLDYIDGNSIGRRGAFWWNSLVKEYASNQLQQENYMLNWDETALKELKKDKYLIFDLRYDGGPLSLILNFKNPQTNKNYGMYFWGRYLTGANLGQYGDDINYAYGNVRIFTEDGKQIPVTADAFSGSYKGRWLTIEVKLPNDIAGGITMHNRTNLSKTETYFSNVRVSDEAYLSDDTVNEVVEKIYGNEFVVKDIFDDKKYRQ